MSVYAYLVCDRCRRKMWLGKVVRRSDGGGYFKIGGPETPSNWERPELNRALWGFLYDHVDHALAVVSEGSPDYDRAADYAEIGAEGDGGSPSST